MRLRLGAAALALLLPLAAPAKKFEAAMEQLGPYKLGSTYEEIKRLDGFKVDEKRSKPAENLVSAKIIDKRVLGTPTIQRFTFKNGRLLRVSIIFHPPEQYPEQTVKAWLVGQWGDPGPKQSVDKEMHYMWQFQNTLGALLPADGHRWMASLMDTRD